MQSKKLIQVGPSRINDLLIYIFKFRGPKTWSDLMFWSHPDSDTCRCTRPCLRFDLSALQRSEFQASFRVIIISARGTPHRDCLSCSSYQTRSCDRIRCGTILTTPTNEQANANWISSWFSTSEYQGN